ncbi:predicted protein [Histoplasma mississippiense (nom. inval.)]|uniref:predicted protein n=1 Tax=Ajellomyces capsulatus (strain NAm1 / WU24) TaxID=2059318 RepID=UPI000157B704|nr:predicted protein [Histoplasma mississippiense (nom. inval.)]EDN03867.1 predicted protein [Histoplasma mississippiense (nom. inval.)]
MANDDAPQKEAKEVVEDLLEFYKEDMEDKNFRGKRRGGLSCGNGRVVYISALGGPSVV